MSVLRRNLLTRPIFAWARKVLPVMSDTEREALEAGDTWWDAELFTGNPDWSKLMDAPPAKLNEEEQAFFDGPVEELCAMLDDWKINWELGDLPPDVWDFMKRNRFFGMIIPKAYGGLEFSATAHSEIVRKISTRSVAAAVTVMVPNSLGPGELLMRFGKEEQRDYWLPRLADGREVPCFGLTSPEAGSDAASMVDTGVVCKGMFQGREVLGLRLNWHKRYITLGPVATVLGLAFKAYDPDRLLGGETDLGITVALVPTNLKGVEIGRRHLPSLQAFQNGPNSGRDVFIPLDFIVGGRERIGQGWKMLVAALAAGRSISLPSLAAAGAAYVARVSGAYARVREQFHVPIGRFEGVEELLGRMAATAYLIDAARRLTVAAIDRGHHPAVISAILKLHGTERMRLVVNDAMDIHGGKAIIDGPQNYLGSLYRAIPIGITVEGANVLTRNLIVFGQGAIRCHPYLLEEMLALREPDRGKALDRFDKAFWAHVGHSLATACRASWHGWTGGLFASASGTGVMRSHFRQLSRRAASFAFVADMALLTMGGALKRKELISARLGDVLSELYLLSAALKRWQDEGQQEADLPLVNWLMAQGLKTIDQRLAEVLANFPNRIIAGIMRFLVQPFGIATVGASDELTQACAQILLEPSAARDRLTFGLYADRGDEPLAWLERAFALSVETGEAVKKMRKARVTDVDEAERQGVVSSSEAQRLRELRAATARVIAVDDFAPEDLSPLARSETRVHSDAAE